MLEHCSVGAFLNLTAFEPERWREGLAELDELGVAHLELWLEFEPAPREVALLEALLAGRRTIMHGPFIGMSLSTHWEDLAALSLGRAHRAVEVAGVLRCEVVTLHAGPFAKFEGHRQALARLAERFARFSRISSPAVALENLPARAGASADAVAGIGDLEQMIESLPGLSVTLDVGHCLQNGEDPRPFIERHSERIVDIHLHDGEPGGGAHRALGAGELPLHELLSCLDAVGYRGFLTVETLSAEDLRSSLQALWALGLPRRRAGA